VLYGQVWEDADVLLDALAVRPGDACLSIASAGDNVLALLARDPAHVLAIDRSDAQIACLELRVAAFRALEHPQILALVGSRPCGDRGALYRRCRRLLSADARAFWDARPTDIARGIGDAGRFERYFRLFRHWVLPLVHGRARVDALMADKPRAERERFYHETWDTWQWRLLFRLFFSRPVMGRLGRRPECFTHVSGLVADPMLDRTRHALTVLNPSRNPYVHWILTGTHGDTLPFALRPENFEAIRRNLDRLEWRRASLDDALADVGAASVDRFNLSDVFEYMTPAEYQDSLDAVARTARPGARVVYWNLLAPRSRPEALSGRLRPLDALAAGLHERDRAFFYQRLVVEEVTR